MELPQALDELISWRWPDAMWVSGECHSSGCYTVWIMDLDYSYNEWLANLSLDGRWTLSPRDVKCYDFETFKEAKRNGVQWRRKARKIKR